jgi:hypothetical protein
MKDIGGNARRKETIGKAKAQEGGKYYSGSVAKVT